jgi:hypothetical protein
MYRVERNIFCSHFLENYRRDPSENPLRTDTEVLKNFKKIFAKIFEDNLKNNRNGGNSWEISQNFARKQVCSDDFRKRVAKLLFAANTNIWNFRQISAKMEEQFFV